MTDFDVSALLDARTTRIIVTCGSGGVGKTTTAAALAVRAADAGRTVAVLTIDPAKRLAGSLGLTELDNVPRRVELSDIDTEADSDLNSGVTTGKNVVATGKNKGAATGKRSRAAAAQGELWAMMLDTRRTFDEMVSAHTTPERAAQILANPFYRTISSSFSGTQEYMAMEKLGQLAATGKYDLIVVDTPPSRSALDFLDAPQRLTSFLDGRMIRLLATPSRGVMKLVGVGFALFAKAVTAIIGGQMLTDAARFVQLFEDMFGGFRARADATYELLRDSGSAFVVVATCQADAMREAAFFADRLTVERMPLAGLILNRTHPPLVDLPPQVVAAAMAAAEADPSKAKGSTLARAALRIHSDRVVLDAEEQRMRARFDGAHPEIAVISIPALPTDVHDIAGLRRIAASLAPSRAASSAAQ